MRLRWQFTMMLLGCCLLLLVAGAQTPTATGSAKLRYTGVYVYDPQGDAHMWKNWEHPARTLGFLRFYRDGEVLLHELQWDSSPTRALLRFDRTNPDITASARYETHDQIITIPKINDNFREQRFTVTPGQDSLTLGSAGQPDLHYRFVELAMPADMVPLDRAWREVETLPLTMTELTIRTCCTDEPESFCYPSWGDNDRLRIWTDAAGRIRKIGYQPGSVEGDDIDIEQREYFDAHGRLYFADIAENWSSPDLFGFAFFQRGKLVYSIEFSLCSVYHADDDQQNMYFCLSQNGRPDQPPGSGLKFAGALGRVAHRTLADVYNEYLAKVTVEEARLRDMLAHPDRTLVGSDEVLRLTADHLTTLRAYLQQASTNAATLRQLWAHQPSQTIQP